MNPEIAEIGLQKLDNAITTKPKEWSINEWPDLTKLDVFNKEL